MALKRLNVPLTSTPLKAGEAVTIEVEGEQVSQFCAARRAEEDAKKVQKAVAPDLTEIALAEIYRRNIGSSELLSSVRLQDTTGARVRFEFTCTYSAVDAEAVENTFTVLTGNKNAVNKYCQEVVDVKFNQKCLYDADGKFQPETYEKYRQAIEAVALELGQPCPLNTAKTVRPLETFHKDRFRVFQKLPQQRLLTDTLPNTMKLVPMPAVEIARPEELATAARATAMSPVRRIAAVKGA
jgi:hypothetical protein